MTKKKFKEIFDRLITYYSAVGGKKVELFDEHIVRSYYGSVYCVYDKSAEQFYEKLIKTCKFFPRIPDMAEVAELFRDNAKPDYGHSGMCYICMNTGIIRYFKKGIQPFVDYEYEHVAHCSCERGRQFLDWGDPLGFMANETLEWMEGENRKKYGNVKPEEAKKAKAYVQRFVKEY